MRVIRSRGDPFLFLVHLVQIHFVAVCFVAVAKFMCGSATIEIEEKVCIRLSVGEFTWLMRMNCVCMNTLHEPWSMTYCLTGVSATKQWNPVVDHHYLQHPKPAFQKPETLATFRKIPFDCLLRCSRSRKQRHRLYSMRTFFSALFLWLWFVTSRYGQTCARGIHIY